MHLHSHVQMAMLTILGSLQHSAAHARLSKSRVIHHLAHAAATLHAVNSRHQRQLTSLQVPNCSSFPMCLHEVLTLV